MKKLTSLFLSVVMLLVFATGVQAQTVAPPVAVLLDEEQLTFNSGQAFIEKATTLVPAEAFLEGLDYELSWERANKTLHASKGKLSFVLETGKTEAMANNEAYQLNVAPKIVNGTLYAPLRFLAENAGYRIDWDAESRAAALALQDNKGFFWKVEKDGVELYLLGSIHVGNDDLYPIRPELNVAYANSDHLVLEVNMAAPMDEQTMKELQKKYMLYDDNTTLPDHIDAETYMKIQNILKENGAPETFLDTFKPWMVYISLDNMKSRLNGFEAGLGIDMYFAQKATASGKSILELESHDSQYSQFNHFSDELIDSMLKEMLETFHQPDNGPETLADLWRSGDEAALAGMLEAMKEIPEYYKTTIIDRNAGMIEKIEGYLGDENKETYFVIAGSFHMIGEDGIVNSLKEKGYTVTRL